MEPEEPLVESAPLAWAAAPERCFRDTETGETCVSYHRVWQYLRLLGIITSTRTNSDFLLGRFGEYARMGRYRRVLVSATADYSMLAHLRCAYAAAGAPSEATVVDRCETALWLNRWYADRHQLSLATAHTDILDFESERPFDLVCTHNFLGRFDPISRRRLVARWHALLRPGGVVVTTQRVMPDRGAGRVLYTDAQARELSARVVAALQGCPWRFDLDLDELALEAYKYASAAHAHAIRTTGEVTELFEAEGFEIALADDGGGPVERAHDRPAGDPGAGAYRMRIVARRPA